MKSGFPSVLVCLVMKISSPSHKLISFDVIHDFNVFIQTVRLTFCSSFTMVIDDVFRVAKPKLYIFPYSFPLSHCLSKPNRARRVVLSRSSVQRVANKTLSAGAEPTGLEANMSVLTMSRVHVNHPFFFLPPFL